MKKDTEHFTTPTFADQTQNAVCDRGLHCLHTGISIKNKIENEKVHRNTRHPLNGKQTHPSNPDLPNGLVHPYHLDVHFEFKGYLMYFIIFILFLIENPCSKRCRP